MPFKRGTVSFASSGPNTRATQLFITTAGPCHVLSHLTKALARTQNSPTSTNAFCYCSDNPTLGTVDTPWETPLGQVVEGMDVIDSLFAGYGDVPPFGPGPDPAKITSQGVKYLAALFPKLDQIISCELEHLYSVEQVLMVKFLLTLPTPHRPFFFLIFFSPPCQLIA